MKPGLFRWTLEAPMALSTLILLAGTAIGDPPAGKHGPKPLLDAAIIRSVEQPNLVGPTVEAPANNQDVMTTAPVPPSLKSPVIHHKGAAISIPSDDYVKVPELSSDPETVTERYPNGKIKIRREVVQDGSRNYINHGAWKIWDERGNLQAEGSYRHGQRHGLWRRAYPRQGMFAQTPFRHFQGPYVSEATFQDGKLHGVWTIQDRNGRKITEWRHKNGLRDGEWTWYFSNGTRMQSMTYHEGVLDGDHVQWSPSGKIVRRNTYQDGRRIESKVERYPGAQKKEYEVAYLGPRLTIEDSDDWWNVEPAQFQSEGRRVKHGPATYWHRNGQQQVHGYYEHGIAQGEFTWWQENGQKSVQGNYRNGQPHGVWMWWRENGVKKLEGRFHQGSAVGAWSAWNPQGEFVKELDAEDVRIFINTQSPGQPPSANIQPNQSITTPPTIHAPPPTMEIENSSSASKRRGVNLGEILNR